MVRCVGVVEKQARSRIVERDMPDPFGGRRLAVHRIADRRAKKRDADEPPLFGRVEDLARRQPCRLASGDVVTTDG